MTHVELDETEYMQLITKRDKLAEENKQLKKNTRIDTLECEIAKMEIENRNFKLKIQDLQRKIDGYEMEEILNE